MPSGVMESELDDRLADAEQELAVAERALGAVELDGGDAKAASRRVAEARAVVDRRRQALAELDRREQEDKAAAVELSDARARWRVCTYYAEYARRVPAVIELRARLEEAEQHLMALGNVRAAAGKPREWLEQEATEGRLSLNVFNALPDAAVVDVSHSFASPSPRHRGNVAKLTVEDCEAWAPKLDALAEKAAEPLGDVADEVLPWDTEAE